MRLLGRGFHTIIKNASLTSVIQGMVDFKTKKNPYKKAKKSLCVYLIMNDFSNKDNLKDIKKKNMGFQEKKKSFSWFVSSIQWFRFRNMFWCE